MAKARILGPVLMIVFGLAMVAGPAQSSVDVGGLIPIDPCNIVEIGATEPCTPDTRPEPTTPSTTTVSTTTTAVTTTTSGGTTTTELTEPTTTTSVTATTSGPTTTRPSGVAGGGANRPPTATQGGALARTGSNTAPLTAGGITLAALGVVLLVAERRRAVARV